MREWYVVMGRGRFSYVSREEIHERVVRYARRGEAMEYFYDRLAPSLAPLYAHLVQDGLEAYVSDRRERHHATLSSQRDPTIEVEAVMDGIEWLVAKAPALAWRN